MTNAYAVLSYLLDEFLLEGLGGPNYKEVSRNVQALHCHLRDLKEELSDLQIQDLWEFFGIYLEPPEEYVWVNKIDEGRRRYIRHWIVRILGTQAFRFNKMDLICELLELDDDHVSVVYAHFRNFSNGNQVMCELIKRSPGFSVSHESRFLTQTILVFLKKQHHHHVDHLEPLIPWLISFVGIKPSGRGVKRIFFSDKSIELLILFSKFGELDKLVIEKCEKLCLSKKKNIRTAAEALLSEIG